MKSVRFGLSITTGLCLVASVIPAYAAFSDVPSSHPYYSAIMYVKAEGIVGGYSNGTYGPGKTINRAEFAKILVAANYSQSQIETCMNNIQSLFTDTPLNAWFTSYICTAFRNNIVSGYPDMSFRPANAISFAEASKMIKEAFGVSWSPEGDQCTYSYRKWFETSGSLDDGSNPYWWQKYVCALQAINALPPSYSRPEQLVTRAEMAEMIYRIKHGGPTSYVPTQNVGQKTYYDAKTGFGFEYFSRMSVSAPKSFYVGSGETGYQISDSSYNGEIWVALKPYDDAANRYEKICMEPDGYDCNRYGQLDLLKQKSDMEKQPIKATVGRAATISDVYAAPGGNLSRDYIFFTDKYRVSVFAHYDLWPLYERQSKVGSDASLSELVEKDLSGNLSNPIERLIALYPGETTLKSFYGDADAIVRSMSEKRTASSKSSISSRSASSKSSSSSIQQTTQQSSSSTSSVANVSGATDLSFTLKGSSTIPETGPLLSYTATVTNNGSLTSLVPVTVRFPKVNKLTYSPNNSDAECVLQSNGDVLCTDSKLAPSKSLIFVVKYTAGIVCGESVMLSGNLNSSEQQDTYVTNDADSVVTSSGCAAAPANLYVTKDSVQVPSHQLLGGTIADSVLRLQLRAEDQSVQIDQLQLTAESANGSTPVNSAARSVDRMEIYRTSDTTPFASATIGACEAQPVPANTFCVKLPAGKLTISAGQTAVLLVRPRMRTDTDGAVSGDMFRLTVRADSASIQATNLNTGNTLSTNDSDQMEDGEVFIGTSNAGANVKISGENQTVVLSKITSVQNNSPQGENAALLGGIAAIGRFRFSAAANSNTKNGLNKAQISDLIFTVRTQNVTLDGSAFQLYNVIDGSIKTTCAAFQTYGAPITGNATGTFHVTCKSIDTSSVNSKIDSNGVLDLALQGNILNAGDITSGTLQVSIESFSNPNLTLIKNANGTINSDGSHIGWNDTDVNSVGPFSWVDVLETEVKSTMYSK